ncbi:MAG TPA: hypothetical protein VHS58_19360 [Acetobacteraceae bacterium]|jgi:hypothetical protein|nr:hypothetical protein [Acetobacteraceae bacterium]
MAVGSLQAKTSVRVYFPHVDLLLKALRIQRDRLGSASKLAVDARLLRMLIEAVVGTLPFSAEFYQETYPDIAAAVCNGEMSDPQRHYIEAGYFEGRLGAPPQVDERFYVAAYPDVADAIRRGEVRSGTEHYIRAGAAEGRVPNPSVRASIDTWMGLLGDALTRAG